MKKFNRYLVEFNSLTKKAISKLNYLGGKSLIVVKDNALFKGILSSRDLRKAILSGNISDKRINKIYNKKSNFFYSDVITENLSKIISLVQKLNTIPILDRNTGKLIDIINKDNIDKITKKKLKKLETTIVIMAGGKGTRLKPYSSVLPKPLLPINEKPVIQHIIEQFNKHGENKFFITLNYKSGILKNFFNTFKEKKRKINLIFEKKPLGTFGSIFKIKKKIKENFFLTNCDTIIKADYNNILETHSREKNDITIVVAEKKFTIPYGVCDFKEEKFRFKEKPSFKHYVNTGFYIISKNCLDVLKIEKKLDFNEFLEICIKNKKKINYYKINHSQWIDVGQMDKYKQILNKSI